MAVGSRNVCGYPWQQMIIDLTGEVVPCCFWSGYGNTGKPLGNTNVQSLEEIWNGEAYRELRRRNASGELEGHPCNECMAYRWSNGVYPPFGWPIPINRDEGHCHRVEQLPEAFMRASAETRGDIRLFEDGVELGPHDALHADIRQHGLGRYSLWGETLFFSTSDNSDPTANGRLYELRCGERRAVVAGIVGDSASGRNMTKAYAEYRAGAEEMAAKPTMISLVSTADCNIDCPACSQNTVRLTRVQHRPQTVPDVLAHVPYLQQFIWQGGEPYLIKRFREFIDGYQTRDNPNLAFGFTSNGTMLTAKELEKLEKFPRINASVSVDSFREETFERIRAGAKFKLVIQNVLRAMERYDLPGRVFSVGMVICKSNFLELAENLRFAIDHDIGVNLSPVVVYPVTEQLDVFSDFEQQTRGWLQALADAEAVLEDAKAKKRPAVRRIDPTGMLKELRFLYEHAKRRYSDCVALRVTVKDPHGSLEKMRRPGVLVSLRAFDGRPIAYAPLDRGPGEYVVWLLREAALGGKELSWRLFHDLYEDLGFVCEGPVYPDGSHDPETVSADYFRRVEICCPTFTSPVLRRNIEYANYGETTPEGLFVVVPQDITDAYLALDRPGNSRRLG